MSYADAWRDAGEDDDFDPPSGNYEVKIIDAGAFAARTDGREWCKVRLQILGTELAGRQFDDFGPAGSHNQVGFRIMRSKLVLYGLNPEGIETVGDLDMSMRMLVGNTASITVTHKDGFRNVAVIGSRTGESDVPADTSDFTPKSTVPDDDDIPF